MTTHKSNKGGVRFAPSPTGVFHVGNFRTAWVSHWWARRLAVPWVVRFEDIDAPRVVKGAQEQQLAELKLLGLVPDQVLVQSQFHRRHWEVFWWAVQEGWVYPCFCSRKDVRDAVDGLASAPHSEPVIYSGKCRELQKPYRASSLPSIAWRFKTIGAGTNDFIVARTPAADDLRLESFVPAYTWACAIDDYDGGYELLVRAYDLEHVVEQQRAIGRLVGLREKHGFRPMPAVYHTALVTREDGGRLEKRTQGVTLAELVAAGHSAEQLLEAFKQSFNELQHALPRGAVSGEEFKELKVTKLLGALK